MFLLLRHSKVYLESSLSVPLYNSSKNGTLNNITEKTCLLCKRLDGNLFARNQSTFGSSATTVPKKKAQKKSRKVFTDILEVTGKSSRYKKANVTKLKPADFNLLAASDIGLSELYKIKDNKYLGTHTYSNLTVDNNFSFENDSNYLRITPNETLTVKPEVILSPNEEIKPFEHEEIHELEDLPLPYKTTDTFQPEVEVEELEELDEPKKSTGILLQKEKPIKTDIMKEQRNAVAAKTLAAYIEVCNHLKNPARGFTAFNFHQMRSRKEHHLPISPMKNLTVYRVLLKGFASKGDYTKLCKVLEIMKEQEIETNLSCYVPIMECLGRVNVDNSHLDDIKKHLKEAAEKGITPDRIMNQGYFLNDERDQVLNALQAYQPNFKPHYRKPRLWYNNTLIDHLNDCKQFDLPSSENSLEYNNIIKSEDMLKRVTDQAALEEKGYITIKSIERKTVPTAEIKRYRSVLDEHFKLWRESAQSAFQRDLAALTAQRSVFNLEPFLRSIPAKEIVEIIVQEAKKLAQGSESYSPESAVLHKMLGLKVYARYRIMRKKATGVLDKTLSIHQKYCDIYATSHKELEEVPLEENVYNPRNYWQLLESQECQSGVTINMGHQPWIPVTLTAIGKFLYHIIMHDLKIDVESLQPNCRHKNFVPAFYAIFRCQGRITKEEVKPHPRLTKLYKLSEPETLTFPVVDVPMLCPPVPWTSINNGGYIISPVEVVRLPTQASTQKKRMTRSDPVQLYPNFDALNQLAAVPWKVNNKILDVILEVFRNGGSAKLDVPENPSLLPSPTAANNNTDVETGIGKYELFKQKLQYRRKKAEMYSLWCDCLYRLSLADHFRNDIFWLPHNMDFRGRVYPIPPHLNHLGSDLARSMLVFAESRPLGAHGLDWLKIHLINLTGLKKRDSVEDRLNFANEMIHLILDSADEPLNGQKWWAQSDEPWQTLACCMEIANVIRSNIDPALYHSHFPVHQDGSCNGLQHYAALGRDAAGAYSVNLAPSQVPQDVYSAVVNLVEQERARDEENGLEIAKVLNGFIKRKVIKQTIMTTVYGVTRFGARLQIAKQLKDIDDFPKEHVWAASSYLTGRTFQSLRTMFTSTREIQDWFTECSRLISAINGSLLEWVTPLGLPVVQPYVKYRQVNMPAGYSGFLQDQYEKPNVMKQKNAFPPNFIHSLDSCHMMLTSLHCARAGITFVSVHDCYWTHASTIHIMNKICREQFVALHSEPILENLSVFLYDLYSYDENDIKDGDSNVIMNKKKLNNVLRRLPPKGDFDIKNVLNSIYFFS